MGRRGRRRNWGRNDPELPKAAPLKGPVIGAALVGDTYREEGVIAEGSRSERWRLTDDINSLLEPDDEFVMGANITEVVTALDIRFPSPVAGVSMIEIVDDRDLKRHTLPFADPAIRTRRKNPNYEQYHWGDVFIVTWDADAVATLAELSVTDDLLISAEAEAYLRGCDDFHFSDLVIGKYNAWYSILKYRPGKAAGRRKTETTLTKKEVHAQELVGAARDLRVAAAEAYGDLRDELAESGVIPIIVQVSRANSTSYSKDEYSGPGTQEVVRQLMAMVRLHAALRGKHAYRHNDEWQAFLKLVRDRPKDLDHDTWGCYYEVKKWLDAECLIKRPKPTKSMLAAAAAKAAEKAAKEAEDLKARTCAGCGTVKDYRYELELPPPGRRAEHPPGTKLCIDCYTAESAIIETAKPVAQEVT